jgi:hypothetical protein
MIDRRSRALSTMLTSQRLLCWVGEIGDPAVADGIPDRVVHSASHRDARWAFTITPERGR